MIRRVLLDMNWSVSVSYQSPKVTYTTVDRRDSTNYNTIVPMELGRVYGSGKEALENESVVA